MLLEPEKNIECLKNNTRLAEGRDFLSIHLVGERNKDCFYLNGSHLIMSFKVLGSHREVLVCELGICVSKGVNFSEFNE